MSNLETQTDPIEEGNKHLSHALRLNFEAKGYEIVQAELLDARYKKLEKRLAAIAWLAEKRGEKENKEKWRFRIPVVISVLALIVSIIAVIIVWFLG